MHYQRALELAPNALQLHRRITATCEAKGEYLKAIDYSQRRHLLMGELAETVNPKYEALRQAFTDSGARGYWRKRLEQFQSGSNPEEAPYYMAAIVSQLGQKEQALDWLEKAFEKRDQMDCLLFDH